MVMRLLQTLMLQKRHEPNKRKRLKKRKQKDKRLMTKLPKKLKRKKRKLKPVRKRKAAKKADKEKRQKLLKEQGLPLPKPQTIESKRTHDETFVAKDDPEILEEESTDEFADLLSGTEPPSLLITTCPKPSKATHTFVKELECVFPFSTYKKRKETTLVSQVVEYAIDQGHTAVMIINEDVKQVDAMTLIHLPHGPTLSFKLSSLRLSHSIFGHGKALRDNFPELVMNNFRTRLGRRIGRSLRSLFHTKPMCHNRQVATFHNQRDYLFFRHHRYVFEKRKEKVKASESETGEPKTQTKIQTRLQELGPRFTLKLLHIQKGLDKNGRRNLSDVQLCNIIMRSVDEYCLRKQWMYHIGSEKAVAIGRFLREGVEMFLKNRAEAGANGEVKVST